MMPSIFGENMFDDFWNDAFDRNFWGTRDALYGKRAKNLMKTDIKELDNGYEIDIDLPGFKKDELNIELKNGYLTVSAAKSLDRSENDKNGRFIRQERYSGACSRSFYVGDLRGEDIRARYEDGILHLRLPKADQKILPPQNRIEIE